MQQQQGRAEEKITSYSGAAPGVPAIFPHFAVRAIAPPLNSVMHVHIVQKHTADADAVQIVFFLKLFAR